MTYSPTPQGGSTIGAGELNCRVRNGNGWDLSAVLTRLLVYRVRGFSWFSLSLSPPAFFKAFARQEELRGEGGKRRKSARARG
jgi:hypothetical protein